MMGGARTLSPPSILTLVLTAVPLAVAGWAALIDVRSRRLPNRLVAVTAVSAIVVAAIVASVAAPSVGRASDGWFVGSAMLGCLAAAAAFAGPLLLHHVVFPSAVGLGDVKLALALAPLLAVGGALAGLLALCVASGSATAAGFVTRRSSVPFGPSLVLGAAVGVSTSLGWA